MVDLMNIPMKSRLLLIFKEEGELWTTEATDRLLEAEGMNRTERWLWVIRFYMMEMSVNGMLEVLEEDVAPAEYYGQEDVIITKYRITNFGIERVNDVLGV